MQFAWNDSLSQGSAKHRRTRPASALFQVHLDKKLDMGSDTRVEMRGNNFSLGERQLFLSCFGRVGVICLGLKNGSDGKRGNTHPLWVPFGNTNYGLFVCVCVCVCLRVPFLGLFEIGLKGKKGRPLFFLFFRGGAGVGAGVAQV